jgi:hypothetical protein
MSSNLWARGFDLPQLGTHMSLLIFDEYLGGNMGVERRYLRYLSHRRQSEFNALCRDPKQQQAVDDYWKELMASVKAAGITEWGIV